MKFAVFCLVASAEAITLREPVEETLVQTEGDKWTNWPNTNWAAPNVGQPNFAGAPERVHVLDPVAYQSRANTPSYLGNRRTTFYGQTNQPGAFEHGTNWPNTNWAAPNAGQPNFAGAPERVHVLDPVAYQSRANTPDYFGNRRTSFYGQLDSESESAGDKWTNWPNTNWAAPNAGQPNFAGAPERVHVLDPVAYQSRANTPSYLGNRHTTFYGQLDAESESAGDKWTNWPKTNWAAPNAGQPNFAGAPERVHVLDPVAYQSRANTPSYLGNRRTTFYAQSEGDDQPEGTNQGVNQLTVTQKDKAWQEGLFRKAFKPQNQSVKQWNPSMVPSLAQWGETDVDALPAAEQALANKATEAGKFASWNKPFAQ